jgi:hypothetical protein
LYRDIAGKPEIAGASVRGVNSPPQAESDASAAGAPI